MSDNGGEKRDFSRFTHVPVSRSKKASFMSKVKSIIRAGNWILFNQRQKHDGKLFFNFSSSTTKVLIRLRNFRRQGRKAEAPKGKLCRCAKQMKLFSFSRRSKSFELEIYCSIKRRNRRAIKSNNDHSTSCLCRVVNEKSSYSLEILFY